jgi:hypothetical protein
MFGIELYVVKLTKQISQFDLLSKFSGGNKSHFNNELLPDTRNIF